MRYIATKLILFTLVVFFVQCSQTPPYSDTTKPVEERVQALLNRMSLEDKIALTHANSKFTVGGIDSLGIPVWNLSDGPHGVREEINPHDWESAGWTTDSASYLPTGTALAATFNPDLAFEYGKTLGREARARNKDVILGPGINIMRTPLCGRNFEYMGEDPFLISEMVVPYIKGVQEQDVAACLKHFVLNNQEYERDVIDVFISERALREIYLPGYKAAVKEGGVLTVMTGYNKVYGDWCSENAYLLDTLLKGEWGFKGAVISDWDGTHSTIKSALAGLDVEMGTKIENYNEWYFAQPLREAVESGKVDLGVLDNKVKRVLTVMFETKMFDEKRSTGALTPPEHIEIALKTAQESMILLKNADNLLPLHDRSIHSIAVIGGNATEKHAHEGGSSAVKALYEVTPLEGLKRRAGENITINYAPGYSRTTTFSWTEGVIDNFNPKTAQILRQEAVLMARKSDIAIVVGGLNHDYDCEAYDRTGLELPYEQDKLISAVLSANPNTIVVLVSGSPVAMPWVDNVPAIIQAWYAGMEGGNALAAIIFGDINPSGRLPFTFPKKLEDSPAHAMGNYPGENQRVTYEEGIMVGYRYFDTNLIEPLFPFGHGLSYTRFEYSGPAISKKDGTYVVSCTISNDGKFPGAEVVQLYVTDIESSVRRPDKELKAFRKLYLRPGQKQTVTFELDQHAFAFYDTESSSWKTEPGLFDILLGSSSRDIRLTGTIEMH